MTSPFTQRNLRMQGFASPSDAIVPWLRWTPSLSTLWIATGTALGSPPLLFGFAVVSGLSATRHRHAFDLLYNGGLRRLTSGESLPENPPPRRFAMALAALWAATTGALFATGHRRAGAIAGGLLTAAGATVASTHFCVGSFVYRLLTATSTTTTSPRSPSPARRRAESRGARGARPTARPAAE